LSSVFVLCLVYHVKCSAYVLIVIGSLVFTDILTTMMNCVSQVLPTIVAVATKKLANFHNSLTVARDI